MFRDRFSPPQRDHVVRSLEGFDAFLPPPLPPVVRFDGDLVRKLSAADRALGELAGVGRTLPSPHLFTRALLRREAVLSSRIEGTQATLSDLVLFEIDRSDRSDGDVREVANYVSAMDYLLIDAESAPVSLFSLREAHRILLTGVRGETADPGRFRDSQNWIGSPGDPIDHASYVPPPPERLRDCLEAFENHLRGAHELPPLVEIACLHYQFEAIHPFRDGNGRVGRLLVSLLLVKWGLLPGPMLDFSAYIEPRRQDYYARLQAVSTNGAWEAWIEFFLQVVAMQAKDVLRRANELQRLRDEYRERVTGVRSSSLLPKLVDALFETPALTIGTVQEVLGVTHRAATVNVEKLLEEGMVVELERSGRVRRFLANRILDVVNGASR
ncbi:Fic family protein [Saccharothrix deserti]|uniref:Fic family protein n=1 Tax=Saccharothrix deserti TaxID=2593674 RepID=UPI00131A6CBD|nr:Fic family protein [Saccharothrix deserti]